MRVLKIACRHRQVLSNVILCMLLMFLFANHLLQSTNKTPIENAEVETEIQRIDYNALSQEEKIQALYDMASSLFDITGEIALKEIIGHLRILKTRKFAKSRRPESCDGCMEYRFKNMINPTQVCQGKNDILLFIIITTVPKEVKERAAVRQTWASLTDGNTASVRHLFLFGGGFNKAQQDIIDEESHTYKDILQEDFIDNYYNLSYKAIMGYRWVTNNCPKAKFILRTAADNFIHIPKVMDLLQNRTINGHRLDYAQIGHRLKDLMILRTPRRKWYITADELNPTWRKYPEYCIGTAFVFHREAVKRFLKASVNVPNFVIEDAYIGLVMHRINLPVVHIPGFTVDAWKVGLPERRGCPEKDKWFSIHLATPEIIQQLWTWCEENWTLPQHLI